MHLKHDLKKKQGFTLVEAVATLGLCSITVFIFAAAFNYSLVINTESKMRLAALNDARRIMEQVRIKADTSLTGTNSLTDSNYWSNVGGTGWLQTTTFSTLPSATRTVTFPSGTGSNPVLVQVTVTWVERGRTQTEKLVTKVTKR